MIKWISVKDEMPAYFVSVLGYIPEQAPFPTVREVYLAPHNNWFFCLATAEYCEVTHWAEMPEPPEEDESND